MTLTPEQQRLVDAGCTVPTATPQNIQVTFHEGWYYHALPCGCRTRMRMGRQGDFTTEDLTRCAGWGLGLRAEIR